MFDYLSIISHIEPKKKFYENWEFDTKNSKVYYHSYGFNGLQYVQYYPATNKTIIKGSIHKFYSFVFDGLKDCNYNQFDYWKVKKAVHEIESIFGIPANAFEVKSYEFGLNVETSFDPAKFLQKNVITHAKNFRSTEIGERITKYLFTEYDFKFYDKAKIAKQIGNILRIERKVKKGRHAKTIGINTLQDLLNTAVWNNQFDLLEEQLEGLIVFDDPELESKLSNPKYWESIRKKRTKKMRLINSLPESNLKKEVKDKMKESFNKMLQIPHIVNGEIVTRCKITGLNISHQRSGSLFISEASIQDLPKDQFNALKLEFLTIRHISEPKDIQAYYIAHNIRNRYYSLKKQSETAIPLFNWEHQESVVLS